jgi:hypothetical protein
VESNEGLYHDYHSLYDKLRAAVKEAWDMIGAEELQVLVREMPARCQAVINVEGRHTKYGGVGQKSLRR